ncbi:MAG: hypothetical protein IGS03_19035 [Candidatus Sericytochromatia bacterium]|nr:hypothetical protein [Candidatus Sericytochromatia bacterium]
MANMNVSSAQQAQTLNNASTAQRSSAAGKLQQHTQQIRHLSGSAEARQELLMKCKCPGRGHGNVKPLPNSENHPAKPFPGKPLPNMESHPAKPFPGKPLPNMENHPAKPFPGKPLPNMENHPAKPSPEKPFPMKPVLIGAAVGTAMPLPGGAVLGAAAGMATAAAQQAAEKMEAFQRKCGPETKCLDK